mmetsp:Transcript_2342/g.7646  ORF Transcript_2342/g.7646 Transcript_2342/m.7646 type:complete len:237 (+) Transcript_2342:4635-5345(+)
MPCTDEWMIDAMSHRPGRMASRDSPSSSGSKNCFETDWSASTGHLSNQSVVQQLMSDGNMRQRTRKALPTGDMASTMCMFSRTRAMKWALMLSLVSTTPAALQCGRTSRRIFSHSSLAKRLGTSPELRMLLMSSTKDSTTICVSANRKTTGVPSQPVMKKSFLRSSRNSLSPYPLVNSIWKHFISETYAEKRVSDCLPEPPTPTSMALPRGWRSTRQSREMCSMASQKKTSRISLF